MPETHGRNACAFLFLNLAYFWIGSELQKEYDDDEKMKHTGKMMMKNRHIMLLVECFISYILSINPFKTELS